MSGNHSSLRGISRHAFPDDWAQRKRIRSLRRLTQQAMRAKGRGDAATMARVAQLLRRFHNEDVFADDSLTEAASKPTLFQKGVSGIKRVFRTGGDR